MCLNKSMCYIEGGNNGKRRGKGRVVVIPLNIRGQGNRNGVLIGVKVTYYTLY